MFISKAQEISDIAKKQTLFTEVGFENDLIIKGDNSNEYKLASAFYAQLRVGYYSFLTTSGRFFNSSSVNNR